MHLLQDDDRVVLSVLNWHLIVCRSFEASCFDYLSLKMACLMFPVISQLDIGVTLR